MNFGIGDLMGGEILGEKVNTSESRTPKDASLTQHATGASSGASAATAISTGADNGAVHGAVIIIVLALVILWWLGAFPLKGINK